ncbi:MAG: 30S ribosomal protein S12 methylthiotransferase RimO [Clostridiales bacterium]|nr:30S ribosomal protein S12 methylthiotransferase RimO [Clostridiales bacterium]
MVPTLTTDFSCKKFGMISLGCDKNRVDSEKLLAIIKERGCEVTSDLNKANVLIVNTCAFLNASRKESIETIIECAAYKSVNLEKIVVTGCLPQKFIDETFDALTEADVFLGTEDYAKFFEALEKSYAGERVNFVNCGANIEGVKRVLTTPQHYAYLKIAEGCNNRCTYCLIPKIRGKYVSFPMERLLKEAEVLGDVSELIIVAQDVTRYGIDLYGQKKLKDFLQKVTALVNIYSVRLLYCYPDMLDDELIAEIRDNPKIVKYLDIPLQHSEDSVLKLMNRPAGRREYLALINKLKEQIPEIAIRSTFIAGFPGESEENFEGLCEFLKEAQLDNCGFFAYSREPDTPAHKLKGQISYGIKRKRVKKLYEIQRQISADKLRNYVGKVIEVTCDGIDYRKNCFVGRAYFQAPEIDGVVYFNAHTAVQGERYAVLVEKSDSYDLYGRCEDYNG